MKKNKAKILTILLVALGLIMTQTNVYAHPGRTDSSGGHRDNKNKSGLGSYHYHCGGHPPHLHTNGNCPYSSTSSSSSSTSSYSYSKSSGSASSSSSSIATATPTPKPIITSIPTPIQTQTPMPTPQIIDVAEIQINENISSIEVGESKKLTATIIPDNATNKNFTWKSGNEDIATVNQEGEMIAKKLGTVEITATASNGKTSSIKINVKELPKEERNEVTKAPAVNENNNIETNNNNSNSLGEIATLVLLGSGGYFGYKKLKSNKNIKGK